MGRQVCEEAPRTRCGTSPLAGRDGEGDGGQGARTKSDVCVHPLRASLGLTAKFRYLPRLGGGGYRVRCGMCESLE